MFIENIGTNIETFLPHDVQPKKWSTLLGTVSSFPMFFKLQFQFRFITSIDYVHANFTICEMKAAKLISL